MLITLIAGGILAFGASKAGNNAAPKIKNEIERLQKLVKDNPVADGNFAEVTESVNKTLQASNEAVDKGHLFVGLELLARASDLAAGTRVIANMSSRVKSDAGVFESEWGAASVRLTALDKEAHGQDWRKTAVAVRALAEAAQGKSIPLLDGSRGFATANGPSDGLFYMGQAEGEAEFAKFCASLDVPANGTFPLRSYLPELLSLQTKTNAAFLPPKSIDQHPRFITLNAAIKLGRELDASRFYAGALYEYLEAMRNYGMLDAPALDAAQQAQVKGDLSAAEKKLGAGGIDDSLAQLFLERAESYVAHPDGSAPTADEWRSARVILDQVLPAYYAALKPATPAQVASGKTVEITLVRWPYT
jgi:hypothetical protein